MMAKNEKMIFDHGSISPEAGSFETVMGATLWIDSAASIVNGVMSLNADGLGGVSNTTNFYTAGAMVISGFKKLLLSINGIVASDEQNSNAIFGICRGIGKYTSGTKLEDQAWLPPKVEGKIYGLSDNETYQILSLDISAYAETQGHFYIMLNNWSANTSHLNHVNINKIWLE